MFISRFEFVEIHSTWQFFLSQQIQRWSETTLIYIRNEFENISSAPHRTDNGRCLAFLYFKSIQFIVKLLVYRTVRMWIFFFGFLFHTQMYFTSPMMADALGNISIDVFFLLLSRPIKYDIWSISMTLLPQHTMDCATLIRYWTNKSILIKWFLSLFIASSVRWSFIC